jgi:hypothetical protein
MFRSQAVAFLRLQRTAYAAQSLISQLQSASTRSVPAGISQLSKRNRSDGAEHVETEPFAGHSVSPFRTDYGPEARTLWWPS